MFCTTARSWPLPNIWQCLNFLSFFVSYCLITSLSVTVPQLISHCSAYCSALLQTTAMINTLTCRKQSHTHKHRYINWVHMPFAHSILCNAIDANNSCHHVDSFCCCTCPSLILSPYFLKAHGHCVPQWDTVLTVKFCRFLTLRKQEHGTERCERVPGAAAAGPGWFLCSLSLTLRAQLPQEEQQSRAEHGWVKHSQGWVTLWHVTAQ